MKKQFFLLSLVLLAAITGHAQSITLQFGAVTEGRGTAPRVNEIPILAVSGGITRSAEGRATFSEFALTKEYHPTSILFMDYLAKRTSIPVAIIRFYNEAMQVIKSIELGGAVVTSIVWGEGTPAKTVRLFWSLCRSNFEKI